MSKKIELILATQNDAEMIHKMKYRAFLALYEKYQDHETSPVKEPIDNVIRKLSDPNTEYYIITASKQSVGAVRVVQRGENKDAEIRKDIKYVSPLFILPEYQDQGIGQYVLKRLFEMYPKTITWRLETIKQEARNCHLYEKCGFVQIGAENIVNERMTLIEYELKPAKG